MCVCGRNALLVASHDICKVELCRLPPLLRHDMLLLVMAGMVQGHLNLIPTLLSQPMVATTHRGHIITLDKFLCQDNCIRSDYVKQKSCPIERLQTFKQPHILSFEFGKFADGGKSDEGGCKGQKYDMTVNW